MVGCLLEESDNNKENLPPNSQSRSSSCKGRKRVPIQHCQNHCEMSKLSDVVARLQMEQEERYMEVVMSGAEKLQSKLQTEMASRIQFDSTF
ncbi:unnamed protein product [Linum tenue]|uniref:Uncharacterized protein n=1 Tax=Linum tenue TaxID=586396 RepID=A0AAV0MQA9_9ROSI|nr:unnamed protein product [Linum tenue]